MRHVHAQASTIIAAGALLFAVLVTFFALDDSFAGRATTGTRVNITNSTPVNCTTIAYAGYNTLSFSCITTADTLTSLINGSGVIAMYQYVPGSSDLWRAYNPNLPSYVVMDLQFLSRKTGYVLIMNETHTYRHEGFAVFSTDVPLVAGWNLVGYPIQDIHNATDQFGPLNITAARTYNTTLGTYLTYPAGTLVYTIPGEGYWINATQAQVWSVTQ